MITKFKSKIVKGNNNGAGFFKIPKEKIKMFEAQKQYRLELSAENSALNYFAVPRKNGFYVPTVFTKEHNLVNKKIDVTIQKSDGFFTTIGSDGQVYIPSYLGQKLQLQHRQIILMTVSIGNKRINKYVVINLRTHEHKKNEYMTIFSRLHAKASGVFKIETVEKNYENLSPTIDAALRDFNHAPITMEKSVVFLGRRAPIQVQHNVKLIDIAHYLGAYFADGTKKGNSWAIAASTIEQAKYYIEKHQKLIEDSNFHSTITITRYKNDDKDKSKIAKFWSHHLNLNILSNSVRLIKTGTKNAANRNPHGTLILKEHRQLTLLYYNRLLQKLLKEIEFTQNKDLAWRFLHGVLEGDGYPTAASRPGIAITTNLKEIEILKSVFSILEIKHEGYTQKGNKAVLRIGVLDVLDNLLHIKNELFKYYPKRMKKAIERFLQAGTIRFILGRQQSTSGWIKKHLKDSGIVNEKYKLTKKGRQLKNDLLEMEKEITVR